MLAQHMHECQTTAGVRERQEKWQQAWMEEAVLERETLDLP